MYRHIHARTAVLGQTKVLVQSLAGPAVDITGEYKAKLSIKQNLPQCALPASTNSYFRVALNQRWYLFPSSLLALLLRNII